MPKILERDPHWLSSKLFQTEEDTTPKHFPDVAYDGPLRKTANRGSELFVAVGTELRWSDVGLLRDAEDDAGGRYGSQLGGGDAQERTYRVCTDTTRYQGLC